MYTAQESTELESNSTIPFQHLKVTKVFVFKKIHSEELIYRMHFKIFISWKKKRILLLKMYNYENKMTCLLLMKYKLSALK